jgi:hypothetical protein
VAPEEKSANLYKLIIVDFSSHTSKVALLKLSEFERASVA